MHIVAFEDLVKTLRGTNQGVGHVGLDVRRFEAEVQRVEHTAEMQRSEFITIQKISKGLRQDAFKVRACCNCKAWHR